MPRQLSRRRQHAHPRDAKIVQDLRADAVGAQHGRMHFVGSGSVGETPCAASPAAQFGVVRRAQVARRRRRFSRAQMRRKRGAQRPAARPRRLQRQVVPQAVVQSSGTRTSGGMARSGDPADQRSVQGAVRVVPVPAHPERADFGLDGPLRDALDGSFRSRGDSGSGPRSIRCEDRVRCEAQEIRPARHRAVVVEHLHDDGRRLETGEAREVAAGFGVSRRVSGLPPGCAISGNT